MTIRCDGNDNTKKMRSFISSVLSSKDMYVWVFFLVFKLIFVLGTHNSNQGDNNGDDNNNDNVYNVSKSRSNNSNNDNSNNSSNNYNNIISVRNNFLPWVTFKRYVRRGGGGSLKLNEEKRK